METLDAESSSLMAAVDESLVADPLTAPVQTLLVEDSTVIQPVEESEAQLAADDEDELPFATDTAPATVPISLTEGEDGDEEAGTPGPAPAAVEPAPEAVSPLDAGSGRDVTGKKRGENIRTDGVVPDLHIRVTDPKRHGDGLLDSYVVYTVKTETSRPQYGAIKLVVRRRYSDFLWLHEFLTVQQPTSVIPPMPPKHNLKRLDKYDPAFLEIRRAGLERFMRRIAEHPVLSCDDGVRMFLQLPSHEFLVSKKDKERGVFDKMGDSLNALAAKLIIKEPDEKYVQYQNYTNDFEAILNRLVAATAGICSTQVDIATLAQDATEGIGALAELEEDLKTAFFSLQTALRDSGPDTAQLVRDTQQAFEAPLREYELYALSIREVLKKREGVQLEHQIAQETLQSRRDEYGNTSASDQKMSFGAILGRDPAAIKQEKMQKLENQLQEAEEFANQADDQLDYSNTKVSADIDRWHSQKNADVCIMLADLADSHVAFYEEAVKRWDQVVDAFEGVEA